MGGPSAHRVSVTVDGRATQNDQPASDVDANSTAITGCGFAINTPGNYHLANDLVSCPGDGVTINSSNVVLRLNGENVSGQAVQKWFALRQADAGNGIQAGKGISGGGGPVKIIGPGTISGFWAGISYNKITDNGGGYGILLFIAARNLVSNNQVFGNHTGIVIRAPG